MSTRIDLIERVAARLRNKPDADAAAAPMSPPPALEPRPVEIPTEQRETLSRHIVLNGPDLARKGILMPWSTTARVVEEFRLVKRKLMRAWGPLGGGSDAGRRRPRIVMVTSARPREGKTFSSVNLAVAFAAERDLTVVLVDADTVHGDAGKTFQLPLQPGLVDVLRGECSCAEALIQTDLPNLVILPSGAPGLDVPELLSGDAPGNLFSQIAEYYPNHVIIVDTPPCLASTDAGALASSADQVVFVVRAGYTQQPEIELATGLISGSAQVNLLLNLVPTTTGEHFGSYDYYQQITKSS